MSAPAGVCLVWGVSGPGGVCSRGSLVQGCVWSGGRGCLLWGVSGPGGVCSGGCLVWSGGPAPGGCLLWEGSLVWGEGVFGLRGGGVWSGGPAGGVSGLGVCVSGWRGVCSGGFIPACTEADTPPPPCGQTDACENITLAQLRCGR